MAGEWTAAYRLVMQDGVPVVAELRVFRSEPDDERVPGRWSAELLGDGATVPRGGLTRRLLRKVPVGQHRGAMTGLVHETAQVERELEALVAERSRQLAEEWSRHWPELKPDGREGYVGFGSMLPTMKVLARTLRRRPGRRGRDDRFYLQVAVLYGRYARRSSRPAAAIAEKLYEADPKAGVSEGHIRDLIHEARRRGLLTRALRGRAGGDLTEKARQMLEAKR